MKKMDIFQTGQSMDFVQKSKFFVWVFFYNFFLPTFFTELISGKIVFDIVEREE